MYPEDVTFRMLILEPIAVFNSNLGFPGSCVSPYSLIDLHIISPYSADASQRNTPVDLEPFANLSYDVFSANKFSVSLKDH